ncbi:MAG: hypothetical protein CMN30_12710 [Sandaracinus sp.]|nr:hypothetical protein [Sandaracinus sp.]|tara:strand:+ start:301 stop:834 length:534 start_codon:yes stop_codon:yes gene_type:complete
MALTATLYRIELEICDVDRGVYETLDLRVAQHPSEGADRLCARVVGYGLLYEEGLEFGRGLSTSEEPALWTHDLTGQLTHWVDVGVPSADRIHIASKRARVTIVCHKGEEALAREMDGKKIHQAGEVQVIHLDPAFVADLAERLERKTRWVLMRNEGELTVTVGDETFGCPLGLGTL